MKRLEFKDCNDCSYFTMIEDSYRCTKTDLTIIHKDIKLVIGLLNIHCPLKAINCLKCKNYFRNEDTGEHLCLYNMDDPQPVYLVSSDCPKIN